MPLWSRSTFRSVVSLEAELSTFPRQAGQFFSGGKAEAKGMSVSHWQSDMNLPRPAETIVRPLTTFPCLRRVIKVPLPKPQTLLLFLLPSDVEIHLAALSSTLFWAKRCGKQTTCVHENTTYQSHQKGLGGKGRSLEAGDKHSHKSLPSLALWPEQGLVYPGVCAMERVTPNLLSARTQTSRLVCSPHIKKSTEWDFCPTMHHVAPAFLPTRTAHHVFPHSYTNSPLIRAEKCDFQQPLSSLGVFFFFFFFYPPPLPPHPCPIPAPPAWCWPGPAGPTVPPPWTPPTLGRGGPGAELWLELISGAHLEAGRRLPGDSRGPWSSSGATLGGDGALPPHGATPQAALPPDVADGAREDQKTVFIEFDPLW